MNANERELLLKDEVYAIVGAAMEVSNLLGSGYLETVYKATEEPVGMPHNFRTPKLACKRMAFTHPTIRVHSRSFAVIIHGTETIGLG